MENLKSLETLNDSTMTLVKKSNEIQIIDDETMNLSSDHVKLLNGLLKKINTEEKSFTQPLKDTIKKISDRFKPLKDLIDIELKQLKVKQGKYLVDKKEKEFKEAEERKKSFQESMLNQAAILEENGFKEQAENIVNTAANVRTKVSVSAQGSFSSTALRRNATYEIIDFEKVHRSLLMINEAEVKKRIENVKQFYKDKAEAEGLKGSSVNDYVFEKIKDYDLGGLKIIVKESVSTR